MGKKVILGKNDFKSICIKEDKEYLLTEWSYEKNTFMPTEISYGSNNKIWWLCPNCNNEYHATVYHRLEGTGCPKCSYKERVKTRIENRIKNKNTFGDKHPELLNEWDYEKNKGIDPYTIAPNYTKNVWWKCMKGHSWQAITPNRIKGRGCPYCSNKKIVVGENDFASEHPELLSEWDYERNEILPTQITSGSMKQVYWKCYKGHSWKCAIPTRKISGCPYCGNKKIIVGENDLATTNPELLSEWDYDKNDKAPQEVVRGSDYYAWWKCENGHTWRAKITNRVHGTSCPICKKYMRTSFFEQAIFYYVHKTYPDTINTYNDQGFEIDIYIPSIKIGIEYDGQKWHKNIENDIRKNMKCKKNGIRLIRIREKGCPAVDDSFDTCIFMDNNHEKEFERCLIKLLKILSIDSIDVNLNRDRQKIYENYIFEIRQNSIGIKIPQLVKEWHPTKNGLVTPYMLPCGTQKKVWWMCAKGHEWQSSVYSRTSRSHSGCPVCSNKKIITGINDLTTIAPEILEFWDYEKNSILPSECYLWRNKKFWWKCDEGHTWEDTPYAVRKNQNPCPICGGRKLLSGYNDFATIHKNGLLKEWNYEKNILDPSQILPGINDKVWWRCSKCGYSWEAKLSNRVCGNKTGCPKCADEQRIITRRKYFSDKGKSLMRMYPDIAKEWHPYRNKDLPFNADTVGAKSDARVWWKCYSCGFEWQAQVRARTRLKSKCRICAKKKWKQKYGRSVRNIDTGEIFLTVADAARKYECTSGNIRLCCEGRSKTARGYHWEYYNG